MLAKTELTPNIHTFFGVERTERTGKEMKVLRCCDLCEVFVWKFQLHVVGCLTPFFASIWQTLTGVRKKIQIHWVKHQLTFTANETIQTNYIYIYKLHSVAMNITLTCTNLISYRWRQKPLTVTKSAGMKHVQAVAIFLHRLHLSLCKYKKNVFVFFTDYMTRWLLLRSWCETDFKSPHMLLKMTHIKLICTLL